MPVATIDPTPGPADVTNFEQVRGGPPAPHPRTEPPAAPARPAQPAARAATPAPEPAPEPEPVDTSLQRHNTIPDSTWDELEKFKTDVTGAEVKPEPAAAPEGDEAEPAPAEPAAATEEPPAAQPDDAALDADLERQVQALTTLKAVRTAHKEALKRERQMKAEQETLRSKLTELETKIQSGDLEPVKAVTAELEAARKRAEELDAQVRVLDYTKSSEFHDKHVKPVAKALEAAYADVREMLVQTEDGAQRPATEADFKALLTGTLTEATAKAKQMFGDLAPEVLAHRRAIVQLERAKREAVETASKASEEALQRQSAEAAQRQQKLVSIYQQRRQEIESKLPELLKAPEGDSEAAKVLEAGRNLAAQLENPNLDDESRVRVGTDLRVRAEAFGHVVLQRNRLQAQVQALTEKLKAYERSEPRDGGTPPGGPAAEPADPMERSMKGLEKFATRVG